jgi:deoxycytidylate deaminase
MEIDPRIKVLKENPLGTRPNWDEYFLAKAIVTASRSSCLHVNSGTEVSNKKHEGIGSGYNGASFLVPDNCLDIGCRKEMKGLEYETSLDTGHCIGIHSEMNGTGHLTTVNTMIMAREDLEKYGRDIHTTVLPCPDCMKNIQPYGITRVVFKRPYSKRQIPQSMDQAEEAGIDVYQLDLSPERFIDIVFRQLETVNFGVWSLEERERMRKKGIIQ